MKKSVGMVIYKMSMSLERHRQFKVEKVNPDRYFFDENHTRYQLVKSQAGNEVYNWLFLPGGPGVDSDSLLDLTKVLDVPGNYWLIDLPFNGTNQPYKFTSNEIYKKWGNYLIAAVRKFQNPILVGHSFGGFFPLFFPQLESILKGFVILNSVPNLDSNIFAKCAQENHLPPLACQISDFVNNPTIENMKALYLAEADYFFAPENLMKGIESIVEKLSYCLQTEHWFYTEGAKELTQIKWVPQKVPTLIVGGSHDCITPFDIFKQDQSFLRDNIEIFNVANAGHFPWFEQPHIIRNKFTSFVKERLLRAEG